MDSLKSDMPMSIDPNRNKIMFEIEDYIRRILPIN